jgi:hypothetical protein
MVPGGRCVLQLTENNMLIGKLLNRFYSISKTLHPAAYALNKTTMADIHSVAVANGLELIQKVTYPPLLPGMSVIPEKWLIEYQLFAFRRKVVS